jgi:hypothetical protein
MGDALSDGLKLDLTDRAVALATGGGAEKARPLIETTRERVGPTGPAVKAGGRLLARLTRRDSGSARVTCIDERQ